MQLWATFHTYLCTGTSVSSGSVYRQWACVHTCSITSSCTLSFTESLSGSATLLNDLWCAFILSSFLVLSMYTTFSLFALQGAKFEDRHNLELGQAAFKRVVPPHNSNCGCIGNLSEPSIITVAAITELQQSTNTLKAFIMIILAGHVTFVSSVYSYRLYLWYTTCWMVWISKSGNLKRSQVNAVAIKFSLP